MIDLSDKTILITGASRGIGAAIARVCVEAGARVILHYVHSKDAADALAAELGDNVIACLQVDMGDLAAVSDLWGRATQTADRIDGLVNNAAMFVDSPLDQGADEWVAAWDRTMAVNLTGPALLSKHAIEHFKANNNGGTILNIASRAGHRGDDPGMAAYAASKGGMLALTKTIARGLGPDNIRCFAIAPGWVETDMAPSDDAGKATALRDVPLGRMADPSEIGALAAFLLSDLCTSATGATFDVNGASYVR